MRYIAAYLLLQIGGNASPSADDVKKVLGAVGIESEDDRLGKLISELEGKDINELIAEGSSKLASVRPSHLFLRSPADSACVCRSLRVARSPYLRAVLRLAVPRLLQPRRRRRRKRRRRSVACACVPASAMLTTRAGGVRRGHGLRSVRLSWWEGV
ncbi:uncharacterized protein LAESUDRAFT_722211 [Laetiporus sulphureus 93-53]|uniref:60S acidic ribosomal protein P2 n=1 Tax=Laetiporus sulphureus 93-53 TaxID=1314785 RepID=A0A165GAE5_9APHY|nr:uncharacterized protein LAESUDRAFT_722211 [Laetiporus sulphureus 93-53]KZT10067.1 hypothetical protein LAESUDRAFT_722211 [Laetiporus sulphureus 93-53]